MNIIQLRKLFLDFFVQKGHSIISNSSLVPDYDTEVLFTTAGMHPLIPFLMGKPHPDGKRLVNYQKCIRTVDIDNVGDNVHLTSFEMLGNWSLGDYWKEEAIVWSYKFLVKYLGLEPDRIYVTCFGGDEDIPRDVEAQHIWLSLGVPKERIFFLGKDNWWGPPGKFGPCGPDTEIFYDTNPDDNTHFLSDNSKFWEIWNNVFMQYEKTQKGYLDLEQKNIDTGMGAERIITILNNVDSIYETEMFLPTIEKIYSIIGKEDKINGRIMADHIKTAMLILAENVIPNNVKQGYVLRRLIRKIIRCGYNLNIKNSFINDLAEVMFNSLGDYYPEIIPKKDFIFSCFENEEKKFRGTLKGGEKQLNKLLKSALENKRQNISGKDAFRLYDTFGYPLDITQEAIKQFGLYVDEKEFNKAFDEHREKSKKKGE